MKPHSFLIVALGVFLLFVGPAYLLAGDPPAQQEAKAKKVSVGNNVFLEIDAAGQRRVLVKSKVCLREGPLEQLLTRNGLKAHEAILTAAMNAQDIHTALILAGAEAGHPVRFQPKYQPAAGTVIKVFVEYKKKDKTVRIPAQRWIRDVKTKKDLAQDWVFAGSVFIPDPFNKKQPPDYAANDGSVICVANVDTALLDLPIVSSKALDDRSFEANTELIPDMDTPVMLILEPVPAKKK